MINPRLSDLPPYPFARLRALLGESPPGKPPIDLSLGEPQHPPPPFLAEVLADHGAGWRAYPPIAGTQAWKAAVTGWLTRRYDLPAAMIDPAHVLPASGTREILFGLGQLVLDGADDAIVLMPDPAYLPYLGAAVMNGGVPHPVRASAAGRGLPDFASVPEEVWARTRLVYACSPANPQGSVMTGAEWSALIDMARQRRAVLVADECYSEIYDRAPPVGVLEVCRDKGGSLENILVVNSLSKRSSAAGLRSGFVAGDPDLIAGFARLRAYGAAGMPLPIQAAGAALWADEDHVIENRALYRRKMDLAEAALGGSPIFSRPEGGFFLWLDTAPLGRTGEEIALALWAEQGVKTVPGAFMSIGGAGGTEPVGAHRLRVALVHEETRLSEALERLRAFLEL